MSLTSQQRGGPLGSWMRTAMAGAAELTSHIEEALAGAGRPVWPSGQNVGGRHWADLGGAFGQRLALLTQHAPPYYALYGTVSAELADWPAIHHAAAAFPTHTGLDPQQRARACDWRPTREGWLDVGPTYPTPPGYSPTGAGGVPEFMTRLRTYLTRYVPLGHCAPSLAAETALGRACWVLNAWEGAYRAGGALDMDFAAEDVTELLNLAPAGVLTELLALITRAHTSGALAELRALAGTPAPGRALGIAGPVFVPHWADGDLLIGDTLIDVKTVMHARGHDRTAGWLQQLLAYTWLDVADRYRIRRVGLYLARHGRLITWPIDTFTHTLLRTDDPDQIASTCAQFRDLAARVIRDEGADPRNLQPAHQPSGGSCDGSRT
jgi:hypothetical protein